MDTTFKTSRTVTAVKTQIRKYGQSVADCRMMYFDTADWLGSFDYKGWAIRIQQTPRRLMMGEGVPAIEVEMLGPKRIHWDLN
jgi:hypothetical protein